MVDTRSMNHVMPAPIDQLATPRGSRQQRTQTSSNTWQGRGGGHRHLRVVEERLVEQELADPLVEGVRGAQEDCYRL